MSRARPWQITWIDDETAVTVTTDKEERARSLERSLSARGVASDVERLPCEPWVAVLVKAVATMAVGSLLSLLIIRSGHDVLGIGVLSGFAIGSIIGLIDYEKRDGQ